MKPTKKQIAAADALSAKEVERAAGMAPGGVTLLHRLQKLANAYGRCFEPHCEGMEQALYLLSDLLVEAGRVRLIGKAADANKEDG